MNSDQLNKISSIGGSLGNVAGNFLGIPGLGNIATLPLQPIIAKMNQVEEMKSQFKLKYSPNFKYGGYLKGNVDLLTYKGRLHSQGGISVNTNGVPSNSNKEVETGEVLYTNKVSGKKYIFSNSI